LAEENEEMKDRDKTKEQLIVELDELRQRISELEKTISKQLQTEKALTRNDEKYRNIFNQIQDLYYEIDIAGTILELSPSIGRILHYRREELIGTSVYDLYLDPRQRDRFLTYLQNKGNVSDYEITLKDKQGQPIICSVNAVLVRDEHGAPRKIVGLMKDITARKQIEVSLQESRVDLEKQVALRTAELMTKTRQLIEEMAERREAEEKLLEQEEKLRNIIEYSTNMFYTHDTSHVFTYVSPRSRDFFDCEPGEALVRWTEFITDHPANQTGYERTRRAIETGERQPPYELEIKGKKGRKLWVEVREAPVVRDGKTAAIVGAITDITDHRRAEEALRLSEEKYRTILESIGEGYYEVDLEGNLTFFNAALAERLDYTQEEMMGMNYRRYTSEKFANLVFQAYHEVYRTGVSSKYVDWELVKKDGSKIFVETSVALMWDGAGKPTGFRGIFLDITDRKKANESLMESEQRMADIIEFLPDATMVIDIGGTVIAWNKAMEKMTGIEARDILGKGNYEYAIPFYGERRPILVDLALKPDLETEKKYAGIERQGDTVSGEAYIPAMAGGNIYFWGTAIALRNSEGRVVGAIESIRDITDRKRLEREIKTLSITDPLTRLYNSRGFLALAEQQLKISERTKRALLFIYIDLDGMKSINDTLGHLKGDEALVETAAILREVFREADIIARMGGDEFAALLLETKTVPANVLADRLQHRIDLHNARGHRDYTLSMSIGMVYNNPETPSSIDALISQADERMYEQKKRKKR
jgi:diguanylate cyclase (GGDEF)-like protein/PAS domain S-box-containing protein